MLMAGRFWGGARRRAPASPRLALCEGIETGLSVASAVPDLPIWAAGSLGNLAGAGRGPGKPHPEKPGKRIPSPVPDMKRRAIVLPRDIREALLIRDAHGDHFIGPALSTRASVGLRPGGPPVLPLRPPP